MLSDGDPLKFADTVSKVIATEEPLRSNALGLFLNLTVAAENKPLVCAATGLVPALAACVESTATASDVKLKACSLAWSLGSDSSNRTTMAAHQVREFARLHILPFCPCV